MPSVTKKSSSTRAERRSEARRRLLDVVESLLDEGESFTELSVERLAQAAGMSRSTFYVYFEDKGDLLRAWFAEITEEIVDSAKGWWLLDETSTREDLRGVLDHLVRTYRPHTTLMAATYDAAAYDTAVRELVEMMMTSNMAGLRKHIRAGQRGGWIDDSLPATETAAWLTWMAERGFHQLIRGATDAQFEKLLDGYTAVVWNTLYAPTR